MSNKTIISAHCASVGTDRHGLTLCRDCPVSVRRVCYENGRPVPQGYEALDRHLADLAGAIKLIS